MYYASSKRYSQMVYRKCGSSGISLPLISLGLWHNFGNNISLSNIKKILQVKETFLRNKFWRLWVFNE